MYENSYYLHHSYNTNLILVSDLLTESKYTSWNRAFILRLTLQNKVRFVDGTLPCPIDAQRSSRIICNNIITALILNFVLKEIATNICFMDSTQELWLDIQQRYRRKNWPCIFQLCRELSNLTQEQHSVTTYFAKLKTLWNELAMYCPKCSCGKCSCKGVKDLQAHFQTEHAMMFLMGLNDFFSQIRTRLLLMEPEPTLHKALSLIYKL